MAMYDFKQAAWIIKNSISCMDVADVMGLSYSRFGRCKCPIHGWDNPTSFHMFPIDAPRKGGFYCHSCHAKGNVISFVISLTGMTYPETLNWFRDTFNLNFPEIDKVPDEALKKRDREEEQRSALYDAIETMYNIYGEVMEKGQCEQIPQCYSTMEKLETMLKEFEAKN